MAWPCAHQSGDLVSQPDSDTGGHDVLINDENQVLSLREVTRVTLLWGDGHHYVRTSDITVPGPARVTRLV